MTNTEQNEITEKPSSEIIKVEHKEVLPSTEVEHRDIKPLTKEVIRSHNDLIEYVVREEMVQDIHYGIIPGTKDKTLFKPGGDLLKRTFNLLDHYDIEAVDEGKQHRTYEVNCTLQSMVNEKVVAFGTGTCSSLESKYRYYRDGNEVPETKRPDIWNTIKKMAKKRAMLDAVNSFFAPTGFFPGDLTDSLYENRIEFLWNPTRKDLENPDWFVRQLKKARFQKEITEFKDEFATEISMLPETDQEKIKEAGNKRWQELKN